MIRSGFRMAVALLGSVLCLIGGHGMLAGLLGCSDAEGTPMANDGDPFGQPPSLGRSFLLLAVFVLAGLLGVWLLVRARSEDRRSVILDQLPPN
jgi:hypothetical protein